MPERAQFRRAQRGGETVWGTQVPATAILAGLDDIRWRPNYVKERLAKLDGSLAVSNAVKTMGKSGAAQLNGFVSFEDIAYLLEGGYHTDPPSADAGTPIAYTRDYEPALTTENTPKSATLQVGTPGTAQQWQLPGAVPANFELSGEVRGMLRFSAPWIAEEITNTAFTAALTRRSVEFIPAALVKVYIDIASGTMGTTQVTDCITSFTFRSGDLWGLRNCINGLLTAAGVSQMMQDPSLTLELQQGTLTDTLFDYFEADTKLYIRLEVSGPTAIHATPDTFPRIRIDLSAAILEWPEMGGTERENGLVVPITFAGIESNSGSFAKLVTYQVVNSLITLP